MKKIFVQLSLFGILILGNYISVSAGGGDMMMDSNDISGAIYNLDESSTKELLVRNISQIQSNFLGEDYEYNNTHFYSKKFTFNGYISEELLPEIEHLYLILARQEYSPMGEMIPASPTNSKKIEFSPNEVPKEFFFERQDLDFFVTNTYGDSLTARVFAVMNNGETVPFSYVSYIYIQADSLEGKRQHFSNMFYQLHPNQGYPNLDVILEKIFKKLKDRYGTGDKYTQTLEQVSQKIQDLLSEYDTAQNKVLENVNSEEDFQRHVEAFGKVINRYNILNDVRYRISTEIETHTNTDFLEKLFF